MFAHAYNDKPWHYICHLVILLISMDLHIFADPDLDAGWLAGKGLPRAHGRDLIRVLGALARSSSLRDAARACGLSYRHAWGVLGEGARALGAPLVEMGRGRGARLTLLGRRVLEADARVRDALAPVFERLRGELRAVLAEAPLPGQKPHLNLYASHDLALPVLARQCSARLQLDVSYRGADECLAALARGDCDLAGFHVADALPRAAAAAASLGRWLDPRKHQLVHFVNREQGIIVRPGARVRGVGDLARPGVRFMNRPPDAGLHANVDLAIAKAIVDGRADAGFGLRAAAAQHALDFVPLATERYYLAVQRRTLRGAPMQAVIDTLRGSAFRREAGHLPGYDTSGAGSREALTAALAWLKQPRGRSG
jgi:molybdate transport repressor ModE-like protein